MDTSAAKKGTKTSSQNIDLNQTTDGRNRIAEKERIQAKEEKDKELDLHKTYPPKKPSKAQAKDEEYDSDAQEVDDELQVLPPKAKSKSVVNQIEDSQEDLDLSEN